MEIQVQITPDYTSVFITVALAENEKDISLSVEDLNRTLSDAGVVLGIKEKVLEDICKSKSVNQKTLVAECIFPEVGEDARVEIIKKPKKTDEIHPVKKENDEIDYIAPRDGFITYVRDGEVLAFKYPPTRGKPGKNVMGRAIPGKYGKEISLDLFRGKNTKIQGDKLLAGCDGIVTLEALQVGIEIKHTINDHVGRNSGSIDLPKDLDVTLIVNGDVQRGFFVRCNRLFVTGCVEDAEIDCNVLKIKGGIVGVGDRLIQADRIYTGYINGERKVMGRLVNVLREISSGAKVMGELIKAYTIQGATAISKEAIWTDYVNGRNTIMVGLNYKAKMEYDELSRKILEISDPLEELKSASYASAKRMKQLKELSKLNPKHPLLQKELPKIMEIKGKLEKFEKLNEKLHNKRDECEREIYSEGEPFLLVRTGFSKDTSSAEAVEPDTVISLKEHSKKVFEYGKGGLFYISKFGVSSTTRYNIKELKDKFEKIMYSIEDETQSNNKPAKK